MFTAWSPMRSRSVTIFMALLDGDRFEGRFRDGAHTADVSDLMRRMVKESLDAFVARDTELARRVCSEDADVDALKEQIFRELLTFMMEDPRTIPRAIRLIFISRFLERVADHATNIAEMVVYMVESKMVRHTLA